MSERPDRVRVTLGQLDVGRDRAANVEAACEVVRAAGEDGARLAVLPEYASCYDHRGVGVEHAEPLDGPFLTALRESAAQHGVAVVVGTTVPTPEGEPHGPRAQNVVVVLGPDGGLLGQYAKVHLYDAFGARESGRLRAGDPAAPPLVVDVAGLRVGVLTCYDLRFPESARRLAVAGAELLAVPAAWASGPGKAEQWRTLLAARAIENTAFVAAAGQCGRGRTGRSCLVGPDGQVRVEVSAEPGTVTGEIDLAELAEARARNPVLELRRFDVVPRKG